MRKQSLDFRKDEIKYVMSRWQAGESCSLVGVGSIGKSNLIHHLCDVDVQHHYLNQEQASRLVTVLIDPNLLGPLPSSEAHDSELFRCWAGYELMMHRLFLRFYPLDYLGEDADNFNQAYQALQDGSNPLFSYMGLRYFEIALELLIRRGLQIVFLFDEFEDLLQQLPARFFQTLRGLRDNHKGNVQFMTFTRSPLPVLVNRLGLPDLKLEPFVELFTDNLYFVGPYNEADARDMISRLAKRNLKAAYPESVTAFILQASGAYAGLLRAVFRCADLLNDITQEDRVLAKLIERRSVQSECEVIWKSLTQPEQDTLKAIARRPQPEMNEEIKSAIGLLAQKRLLSVDQAQQRLYIEPPLLNLYVQLITN